jgi:uncharacterized protein
VSLPTRVLTVVEPGVMLPASHPAAGKEPISGSATAYVCRGAICSLPLTEPAALIKELR